MINLAIIGAESSHSWCFAKVIDGKDGTKTFDDVKLLGVYADKNSEDGVLGIKKIRELSNCSYYVDDYNAFLDSADAVMITAPNGANHLKFAREYIKKGIPVWIDKPITCSIDDVCKMVDLAKKYDCIITGGSSIPHLSQMKNIENEYKNKRDLIWGGHVSAPLNIKENCGGFWFYTQHLVQMMLSVFGTEVKSVCAVKSNRGVNAVYRYDNYTVTAFFGSDYAVTVYEDKYVIRNEKIEVGADYFMPELLSFYNVIKCHTADMSHREFAMPVFVIDATIKAFTEQKEIEIINPIQ